MQPVVQVRKPGGAVARGRHRGCRRSSAGLARGIEGGLRKSASAQRGGRLRITHLLKERHFSRRRDQISQAGLLLTASGAVAASRVGWSEPNKRRSLSPISITS